MADITDPTAIAYCNESVRPAADLIAQSYYLADQVKTQWDALGGDQAALDVMGSTIREAAERIDQTYLHCVKQYRRWFANGINVLIPNDTADDAIIDGAPNGGRPAINADDVYNLVDQMGEFYGWLNNGTWSFDVTGDRAEWDTVLQMTKPTLVLAEATNFTNRCAELRTQMEANTNAKLNEVLSVAVNPGGN
mgnify:CR=1 FL=1